MKVRACIYVNPKWCIPYVKSLEWVLQQLGVTDKVDIECAIDAPIYSNADYDLSFFMSGRRSISTRDWEDTCRVYCQLEQMVHHRMDKHGGYHLGNGFDFVLEPFIENMILRGAGKRVFYAPIGYAPTWERPKHKTPKPSRTRKEYDIFFWGAQNPARINQLQKLQESGLNVIWGSDFWDDQLYGLIARSKISLWLKHSSQRDYAQIHCLPAQAQGEFVMVEKSGEYGLFLPDKHFVVFNDFDDLLDKAKYYCEHDKERNEFANNAYNHLKSIPYTDSLTGAICNFLNHIIEQKKLLKNSEKCWNEAGQLPDQTAKNLNQDGTNL